MTAGRFALVVYELLTLFVTGFVAELIVRDGKADKMGRAHLFYRPSWQALTFVVAFVICQAWPYLITKGYVEARRREKWRQR